MLPALPVSGPAGFKLLWEVNSFLWDGCKEQRKVELFIQKLRYHPCDRSCPFKLVLLEEKFGSDSIGFQIPVTPDLHGETESRFCPHVISITDRHAALGSGLFHVKSVLFPGCIFVLAGALLGDGPDSRERKSSIHLKYIPVSKSRCLSMLAECHLLNKPICSSVCVCVCVFVSTTDQPPHGHFLPLMLILQFEAWSQHSASL